MPNHTGRLVLTTSDPVAGPDAALLAAALSQSGFIGEPLPGRRGAFSVGRNFLSLLAFSGCAVAIAAAPGPDPGAAFCHVHFSALTAAPRLRWGRNTRPPRCPGCRSRLLEWRRRILESPERPLPGLTCTTCGETRPPWRWDWKEQGGYGRLFVMVEEVFPGEAVPTGRLLDLLTDACGSGWRHFFVQD
ncbi:hypothetical protein [Candidatus Thiodictyon syntrophicum]|jgi:hypothetical protein|uniref:Uncharacterized protein n=1 Tax=Candidatus Thiodictyon syntrophicum TaxID=1166950 RepID=A0A2K8UBT6_9GAMM|nr:hypothetical protein [Candidatus Thiodictyon syntrophicum]AUB82491.1 hypothetical protein THSYN_17100 [Candidatus Thiodictyon syntrophicum]